MASTPNISGHVVVEFTINVDGTVQDIEIIESEPLGVFDKAVRKAVEKWKFTPIVENDRQVILTNVQTKLTFNLAN
ncbi:MAG: energy transducer TonB [Cellvibrionaceae bacterium]